MKNSFPLLHWVLTLMIAPFISLAYEKVDGKMPHAIMGLVEVYPFTLIFSFVFSLPAFILYYTIFLFLSKHSIHLLVVKLILIAYTILSIIITLSIIEGSLMAGLIILYAATTLFIGLLLPLANKRVNNL